MRLGKWKLLAILAVFALIAAACGDDEGGDDGGETTTTTTTQAPSDDGDDGGMTDIAGTEVSIFGAPTGDEGASQQAAFDVWNEQTGARATYEGSDSFEEQLRIRVEGGNPPDVAILPQPGSICEFAGNGEITSLEDMGFNIDELIAAHGSFFIGLGECDGQHYAIPTNANFKSIVWYNKPAFEAGGYAIPETWDDMLALTEQIKNDGITPWCIGLGSEAATGWPGTDWIEDIMVRTVGVEGYNAWFRHEIPFNDPSVVAAFDLFGEILHGDGYVLGGADQVAAIDFRDAPDPMFNDPPSCLLHRQASFIANFFPEGVEPGVDADFFLFPSIDPNLPPAAMGGGELAIVFDARPEVVQWLSDYSGPTYQCVQASPSGGTASTLGGHGVAGIQRISAHAETPLDCYEDETTKVQAGAVAAALAADGFVFDASDVMPSAVGTGTFWEGMVDFTRQGPDSAQAIADSIEATWPQ